MAPQTHTATAPSVTFETIGTGADTRRIVKAGAWEMTVFGVEGVEPLIRDTDAAARLGFSQPRDVRKLIERIWPENQRPNCRATVARQSVGRGGKGVREYAVNEYWLTEAEVLKLCARSETPVAESILDEMIAVYMAVRRGLLQPAPTRQPPPPIPLTVSLDFSTHALLSETARMMGAGNTPESIANRVLGMWRTLAATISPPIVLDAMSRAGLGADDQPPSASQAPRAPQIQPSASQPVQQPLPLGQPQPPQQPTAPVIRFHPVPARPRLPPRTAEPLDKPGGTLHMLLLDGWEAFCESTDVRDYPRGRAPSDAVSAAKVMRHRSDTNAPALPEQLRTAFALMGRTGTPVNALTIGQMLTRLRGVEVDGRYFDKYKSNLANLWRVVRTTERP